MNEKMRIEEIKNGLKKSVYDQAAKVNVEYAESDETTEKLSNILEGYVEKIDTIDAQSMEELGEELRVLKETNIEVGNSEKSDNLVQQYNDYIHNDLDRTIAETIEYTHNLNNKTDDLNDILFKSISRDNNIEIDMTAESKSETGNTTDDSLFEIEATTELGILDEIAELEEDTLEIEGKEIEKETKKDDKNDVEIGKEFKDVKKMTIVDYVLILILIAIFVTLVYLIAKINGVF